MAWTYVRNGVSYRINQPNHAENLSVKARDSAKQQDSRFTNPSLSSKAIASAVQQDSRFTNPTSSTTTKNPTVAPGLNSAAARLAARNNSNAQTAAASREALANGGSKEEVAKNIAGWKYMGPYTTSAGSGGNGGNGGSGGSGGSGGYGGGSYQSTLAAFTPSETYLKAMETTNALLEQLTSGRTSYTDKVNEMMDAIVGRDKFSYDMDTDVLFQNMLSGYMTAGQTAMQDTMGQAAGLTGGYGSSYATSAANQAYNAYIQDAYANLPDYYSLALEAYNQEGQDMYNQLAMYQTADDTEWNRTLSSYSANAQNAANIYDREYNNYWQTTNFNEDSRRWADEMNYKQSESNRAQSNWERNFAYQQERDAVEDAYRAAQSAQAQSNWEAQYAADLVKNSTPSASDRKAAFSSVLSTANRTGLDSDATAEEVAAMTAQGYDIDDVLTYLENNIDAPTYSLGNNGYTDQWGNANDETPSFTLIESKSNKNNDVYEDQFKNKYTRIQLEQMGYSFDRKGKQKK